MVQTDARDAARAVALAQAAVATHDPQPTGPRHVVTLPLLVLFAAEALAPGPRLLYLHLWTSVRGLTKTPLPSWFYHTDTQLTRETARSAASLLRARRALREAGLLFTTTNQGCPYHRTYYHLRFPCPLPDDAPPYRQVIWAHELEDNGHPCTPLEAWAKIPDRDPEAARAGDLARLIAQTPRALHALRLSHATRIPEVSPWLYRQLEWADPELYQPELLARTLIASGQQCLPFTPETGPPSC